MTSTEKKALREKTRKQKEIIRQEKIKRFNKFNKVITKTESLDLKELKEEAEELFKTQKVKEANLLEAFNDKRLKSKPLIREALKLKNSKDNKSKKVG